MSNNPFWEDVEKLQACARAINALLYEARPDLKEKVGVLLMLGVDKVGVSFRLCHPVRHELESIRPFYETIIEGQPSYDAITQVVASRLDWIVLHIPLEGDRSREKDRKEAPMEKLGVQTDQEKVKTASEKKTCPKCGRELTATVSNVPHCPECGTEPFEKTND